MTRKATAQKMANDARIVVCILSMLVAGESYRRMEEVLKVDHYGHKGLLAQGVLFFIWKSAPQLDWKHLFNIHGIVNRNKQPITFDALKRTFRNNSKNS